MTFLVNWALARQRGWRMVLRIEDLDGPRVKAGADRGVIEDLRWLGLNWDDGPVWQAGDLGPYRRAAAALHTAHQIYPCRCTRKQIVSAASAPHGDVHETRYPGTCRPPCIEAMACPPPVLGDNDDQETPAWRLAVPEGDVSYLDQIRGDQVCNVARQVGDFVVVTKSGLPAYQLAVVVDDIRQGVTDVVRGDDLLGSTARQRLLYAALGIPQVPNHWHLPLVLGPDGRRLAKRHGDTRIAAYRAGGTPAVRIIALLARWCGLTGVPQALDAEGFSRHFDLQLLPRGPVTFTNADHRWLLEGSGRL